MVIKKEHVMKKKRQRRRRNVNSKEKKRKFVAILQIYFAWFMIVARTRLFVRSWTATVRRLSWSSVLQIYTAGCIQTQFSLVNERAFGGTFPAVRFVREGDPPSPTASLSWLDTRPGSLFNPASFPVWNCRMVGVCIEHK